MAPRRAGRRRVYRAPRRRGRQGRRRLEAGVRRSLRSPHRRCGRTPAAQPRAERDRGRLRRGRARRAHGAWAQGFNIYWAGKHLSSVHISRGFWSMRLRTRLARAALAAADQAFSAKQWDDAIQKYQAILAKAPALTLVNVQIAQAYRSKADDVRKQDPKADLKPLYDQALAAYQAILKSDPNNDKAKIGIGMTNLEKGDLDAAEKTLEDAAQIQNPAREIFYTLGEVKFAKGKIDE